MLLSLKELIVVLVIGSSVFAVARPVVLLFSTEEDFQRRRNLWVALTAAAFLSPSFWLFALVAIPLLVRAGRRDSSPAALYLFLLHVIPPISVPIPMIGISYLFDIDNYLLLSFCVLVPAALRMRRAGIGATVRPLEAPDLFLLGYGVLTSILYIRPEIAGGALSPLTFTDCLRRMFVFFFANFMAYYAITRLSSTRRSIVDALGAYCLACAVLVGIALFESVRHWLLYGEMAGRWGVGSPISLYIARGSSLRAIASTGHALALGYLLAVAFGMWLYLQSYLQSARLRMAGAAWYWIGLLAAFSRGPWIGAVSIYLSFAALSPGAVGKVFKAVVVAVVTAVLVYLSPLHDKLAAVLPFLGGTVDYENVLYRQRLWDRAWQLIGASPVWGDQDALLKMHDLRQGQGIIDLVNTYVEVLLDNGFVGLFLFLSFILVPLFKAWGASRTSVRSDNDLGMLGTSIVCCILGTLLLLENGSFATGPERMFYALAALAAAYARLIRSRQYEIRDRPMVAGVPSER